MKRIYSNKWLAEYAADWYQDSADDAEISLVACQEKTISGVAYYDGDKPNPEGYANLFIEDIGHIGHELGRWYLIIERSEYISDDFAELESHLLEWAREEGYELPADGFGPLSEVAS